MNLFKLLAGAAAMGVILATFRDENGQGWIVPGRDMLGVSGGSDDDEREPILGYDGMDEDTLHDWLDAADVERETLLQMLQYEARGQGRQSVLSAIVDQL